MGFSQDRFRRTKGWMFFYFFLSVLFFLPFCFDSIETELPKGVIYEQFNPKLLKVNSLQKALTYIDSVDASTRANKFDTVQFVRNVSKFTKERFYHGLSNYSISENWLALLSGTIFWDHLSAVVIPDDILKHSKGLCSQQTIVFMEILKSKGVKTRSVGLGYKEGPGHFLTEVYYNKDWHLYDVNMEPNWNKIKNHHKSMEYYLSNLDTLYVVYEQQLPRSTFNKIMGKIKYGEVNKFPAKKMFVFHNVTIFIIYFLPIFFCVMCLRMFIQIKKNNRKGISVAEKKQTPQVVPLENNS